MKKLSQSLSVAAMAGACLVALALGGCGSKEEASVAKQQPIENSRTESAENSVQQTAEPAAASVTNAADQAVEKIEEGVAQTEDVVAETAEAAQEAGKEVSDQAEEQTKKALDSIASMKNEATPEAESHN